MRVNLPLGRKWRHFFVDGCPALSLSCRPVGLRAAELFAAMTCSRPASFFWERIPAILVGCQSVVRMKTAEDSDAPVMVAEDPIPGESDGSQICAACKKSNPEEELLQCTGSSVKARRSLSKAAVCSSPQAALTLATEWRVRLVRGSAIAA
jgi:hypothetical protein